MSLALVVLLWVVVHLPALAEAGQQVAQLLMTGWIQRRRQRVQRLGLEQGLSDNDLLPPISLVAPARNEAVGIVASIGSLLALDYPDHEVVVVEDGSTDDTFAVLHEHFELLPTQINLDTGLEHQAVTSAWRSPHEPRLLVIRKVNGGCKADANNAGICAARNPIVCMVDCDSLLERDALRLAAAPFCREPDRIAAVGGQIRVLNGCRVHAGFLERIALPVEPLALLQACEYLRAFMAFRVMWSRFGALPLISGAFGLFRRDVVMQVGGYQTRSLGEDLDLVMRIHRHAPELRAAGRPHLAVHVPEANCWTEVPLRWRDLAAQRIRWQRGMVESLRDHRAMLFNPRHGLIGLVVLPMFWLIDVVGPFSTGIGLLVVPWLVLHGQVPAWHLDLFLITTIGLGLLASLLAVSIESRSGAYRHPAQVALLICVSLLDNLGYRQLNAWWRLRGLWNHLLRRRPGWSAITRVGARAPTAEVPPVDRRSGPTD